MNTNAHRQRPDPDPGSRRHRPHGTVAAATGGRSSPACRVVGAVRATGQPAGDRRRAAIQRERTPRRTAVRRRDRFQPARGVRRNPGGMSARMARRWYRARPGWVARRGAMTAAAARIPIALVVQFQPGRGGAGVAGRTRRAGLAGLGLRHHRGRTTGQARRAVGHCADAGRSGRARQARTPRYASMRAGDIVGEHTVQFATDGERHRIDPPRQQPRHLRAGRTARRRRGSPIASPAFTACGDLVG